MSGLFSFAVTCLVIELTPGPNMAYLAMLSATEGRRAGLAATIGVALGLLLLSFAAAAGLTAVISQSPALYQIMRWAGVVFLFWMAWEGWSGSGETSPGRVSDGGDDFRHFVRGLMTNLLNPKAALFYIAVLPAFVDPGRTVLSQTMMLSAVSVAIATGVHAAIVMLAATAQPWLREGSRSRTVRRVMAMLLAVIAIWLLVATAR